jgi:hypothetical protein
VNSVKGYKKYYLGPLLLGANTTEERIINVSTPAVAPDSLTFKVQGMPFRLTPVYHLLQPEVSIRDYYMKRAMSNPYAPRRMPIGEFHVAPENQIMDT